MGKSEDRRSKRSKRQKPARFASPTESPPSQTQAICVPEPVEMATTQPAAPTPVKPTLTTPSVYNNKTNERTRPASSTKSLPGISTPPSTSTKKSRKRRNSDTSSDEERWLNAIETGKLEDVDDELKKIKDPKLMTARQRAMYERTQDAEPALAGFVEELIALPSGYREKEKPQTAEEIQKAALKSQKRKQQADERREKDKQKTMERLLKKQESGKQRSAAARNKQNQKLTRPSLTYINSLDGVYIIVPPGQEFPIQAQSAIKPPPRQLCGIPGCTNRKVYSCSKTNIPLCSLACYRKNLAVI
ncbi:INO80 complex subunit B [Drosophila novamexicana]|uniref:INO80 complex subunit B n=1 Tax=Drosophila novamexicana TaxID=47314 RepID=UPI0011E5936B|nr:INO80 complex subunit B [Drosophila novamexicana]